MDETAAFDHSQEVDDVDQDIRHMLQLQDLQPITSGTDIIIMQVEVNSKSFHCKWIDDQDVIRSPQRW